jgi:hypothetical protein
MGLLDFNCTYENIFAAHLKHSSFWSSAAIKPMQNGLVHAMPRQCMFALSMCMLQIILTQQGELCVF